MERTIRFTLTSELSWAATAPFRRAGLALRLVSSLLSLVAFAAGAVFSVLLEPGPGKIVICASLVGVALLTLRMAFFRAKSDGMQHPPIEWTLTFDERGIGHDNGISRYFVAWADVLAWCKTSTYCLLRYTRDDGRQGFTVMPSDVVDGELAHFIEDALSSPIATSPRFTLRDARRNFVVWMLSLCAYCVLQYVYHHQEPDGAPSPLFLIPFFILVLFANRGLFAYMDGPVSRWFAIVVVSSGITVVGALLIAVVGFWIRYSISDG